MSKESVLELIKEAQTDKALLEQLQAAEDAARVLEIAAEKSYEFSEEELLAVMQKYQLSFAEGGELSDEKLEAVAGGVADDVIIVVVW